MAAEKTAVTGRPTHRQVSVLDDVSIRLAGGTVLMTADLDPAAGDGDRQ